ncbi:MAG: hypothetical protein ABIJ41_00800 [Candidatus Omnitrophota bacterium]
MALNSKITLLVACCVCILFLNGCALTGDLVNWTDTRDLEEYGDKVAETMTVLYKYVGKTKEDVSNDFGEPTEKEYREGSKYVSADEKAKFDEIWIYAYMKGIPMINAASSRKIFYFKNEIVVAVDAN